jgi:hypothetical protein
MGSRVMYWQTSTKCSLMQQVKMMQMEIRLSLYSYLPSTEMALLTSTKLCGREFLTTNSLITKPVKRRESKDTTNTRSCFLTSSLSRKRKNWKNRVAGRMKPKLMILRPEILNHSLTNGIKISIESTLSLRTTLTSTQTMTSTHLTLLHQLGSTHHLNRRKYRVRTS